jgi:predicted transposase YbfD/YdcC
VIPSGGIDSGAAIMTLVDLDFIEKPRVRALLDHFAKIADPREPWRVAHPLPEVLLLVVCGTVCDCDDYAGIAAWGKAHLPFLRRFLPFHHGVPGERWLTILMNRIDPSLFSGAFMSWVRESWPDRPEFVAIDGKTSRRSHDRAKGQAPLHLVSAFATTRRLVLGQEAVEGKTNELTAIPALLGRLAEKGGLRGAIVSIDAIATNPAVAGAIRAAGADYLLAVKANQPTLRAEIESFFSSTDPKSLDTFVALDKGHGRIEECAVTVAREVDWLTGERRFPGELRLPDVGAVIRIAARAELRDRGRFETRYYISSASLAAARAAEAVRGHWAIENSLHWVLDVTFKDDQSRLRTGHGAKNMAVVRHFAINLLRAATDKKSLKLRRKQAAWDPKYLAAMLGGLFR